MGLQSGVYLVRRTVSLLRPHWPYSLPPHEYAWPSADTARQCHPPMAAWTIFTPFSEVTRRGFRSVFLQSNQMAPPVTITHKHLNNTAEFIVCLQEARDVHLWP